MDLIRKRYLEQIRPFYESDLIKVLKVYDVLENRFY